ncbi:MAG: endonuclease [Candidatus Neomarinimicrobiota bacterium]
MKKSSLLVTVAGLILALNVAKPAAQTQTIIAPELSGESLRQYIVTNYKTSRTLGYNTARDSMYGRIDLKPGNQLSCVYTGYTITIDPTQNIRNQTNLKNINCEHTWPQSMGAESEPQASDIHHLFPTYTNVNSSRGNDPFAEIPDQNTDKWWRLNYSQNTIPTTLIDEYSEKENDAPQCFEPREDHKGNVARAMFYFYAMYKSAADSNFWNLQKSTLIVWNYYDPVDSIEYARTWKIAHYQDNKPNPFVLDSTLARRIWFNRPSEVAKEKAIPEQMNLVSAYPNPFNASLTIAFSLQNAKNVVIDMYDINGKSVDVLYDGKMPEGNHSIVWSPRNLSTGLYLIRFTTDGHSEIKKCAYLK